MTLYAKLIVAAIVLVMMGIIGRMAYKGLETHFVEPVKVKAKADLDACSAKVYQAETANQALQAAIKAARSDIDAANSAFDQLKRNSDKARGNRAAAEAKAQPKLESIATERKALYAQLYEKADPGGSCEQRMQKVDDGLRAWARERVRYYATSGDGSPAPASGEGAGAPAVRVAP